jgi:predicted RNA-binding protein with PIN domain
MATRWLVDGMNLIGSRPDGWWRDRPAAMAALVSELEAFSQGSGERVEVVFDGRPVELPAHDAVAVGFAPSADDAIAARVAEDPDPTVLRVVTSDRELADRVRAAGAEVVSSGSFRATLDRLRDEG